MIIRDADPRLEQRIDSILMTVGQELAEFAGFPAPDTITVLVATRREQFDSAVGGHFPDWGAGCALPQQNVIIILSPYLFTYQRNLPEVLRHELAHLYVHSVIGQAPIPRWLDEGFAMLIGHQWHFGDDWLVARAVLVGEALTLSQMQELNQFRESKARLAYTQSYLALNFFIAENGRESFLLLLRRIRRGDSWDQALMAASGLDYAGFQAAYTSFLERKYNWVALFSDTALFWMLIVLLVLLSYLFKRWRTKKKIEMWERSQAAEDIFYSTGGGRGGGATNRGDRS